MRVLMWMWVWSLTAVLAEDNSTTPSPSAAQEAANTTTASPGCTCPSVNCKTCSADKSLCCAPCCKETCACPALDCVRCSGSAPCCQMCCQEGPGRTPGIPASPQSLASALAGGQLLLHNLTIVIDRPQVVVRTPQLRQPALCCDVEMPARCSPYGCVAAKSAVTCGPQCMLGAQPSAPRCAAFPWLCQPQCTPLPTWPFLACSTPSWLGISPA